MRDLLFVLLAVGVFIGLVGQVIGCLRLIAGSAVERETR
jgi:hypothetical protein